jgi:NMT1/THI5 like
MPNTQSRRRFLTTAALAGAAGLVRTPRALAAEGSLETTTVRLPKIPSICVSPQYVAEELLRAEGFTDIRYVESEAATVIEPIGRGKIDFGLQYAPLLIPAIDAGASLTVLAGVHVGCFELFAKEGIRTVADLKGRSVGVQDWGSTAHVLVALMAAHVGLDPAKDIRWATDPSVKPIEQFVGGKIDAFMGFPPQAQDLRARQIGHVIVNSTVDHPWSQYFCCMVQVTATMCAITRSRPSGCCAPSSRRRISAPPSRRASRGGSSMAASPRATTMPSRRLTRSLTTDGEIMTPRTRSASTRYACTRRASSSRARRRSSPTAPIGGFWMSSNAS